MTTEAAPVYPLQHVFTLVELVAPGSANLTTRVELGRPVDHDLVGATARALLRRHPALRYGFARRRGTCLQRDRGLTNAEEHLRTTRGDDPAAPRERDPFPLGRGLFLDVVAYDDRQGSVDLTSNHIVGDRWSLWLLRRDFATLYRCLAEGAALPPAPRRTLADFATEDHGRLAAGELDGTFAWWQQVLQGHEGIPAGDGGAVARAVDYAAYELRLTATDIAAIDARARATGATRFAVLSAATAAGVAAAFGQDDVVLNAMAANRLRRSSWDVVGCFTNSVPMRFDYRRHVDPWDQVHLGGVAEALTRGTVPYAWIVERLGSPEHEAFTPNSARLVLYVHAEGSPDTGEEAAEPHAARALLAVDPASTWGLDLDLMVDFNLDRTKAIRGTFRPGRVQAGKVRSLLEGLGHSIDIMTGGGRP